MTATERPPYPLLENGQAVADSTDYRMEAASSGDMLVRAWRMGYLAGCHDPSDESIVRANLKASEEEWLASAEPVTHHPACVKYGDDSGCDACNR